MPSPVIDQTIAAMTAATTVIDSAIVFVADVPRLLTEAINAAIANGATAAELEPVSAYASTLTTRSADLVAALAANTPSPPPTPPQLRAAKGKP